MQNTPSIKHSQNDRFYHWYKACVYEHVFFACNVKKTMGQNQTLFFCLWYYDVILFFVYFGVILKELVASKNADFRVRLKNPHFSILPNQN